MTKPLQEYLTSADPLSDEAMIAALDAREENAIIDFKLDLENADREWLEVTKDIMAFANTEGGYLVFGVRNGTYEKVGLSEASVKLLSDTNNLMQKFNKCVEPAFSALRSKAIERDGKKFVVVLIPASHSQTHMVAKEGAFTQPSSVPKVVLRPGTFYVRRSGANQLAGARDLDALIERRMQRYRVKLLEGITRVVEAPVDREVFVVKQHGAGDGLDKKFVIEDAPDAIAVKGMSFTIPPETLEEEIAALIAVNKSNSAERPTARTIWKWYAARERVKLIPEQRVKIAAFSLMRYAPVFYWLQGCPGEEIREALGEILKYETDVEVVSNTLIVSAYLGKRFHKSQVAKIKGEPKRFGKVTVYPTSGPRSNYEDYLPRRRDKKELLAELNGIAASAQNEWDGQPIRTDRWRALRIDSFLYAQDEYPDKRPERVVELAR